MKNHLAIIIPAYKTTYLHETLKSISNQTSKEFTLYIGDDASPSDIYEIVKCYEKNINIVYKRFTENLGGVDLIAQWNRCIDMSNEKWIWLFSDDDIMAPDCVELFYKHIQLDKESQILHFNTEIIDEKGLNYAVGNSFPLKLSSADFFKKRIGRQIFSFAVEYIFTRNVYETNGKFQIFDLAWCSDDATWIKFGARFGITTIHNKTLIYWRYSGENISSLNTEESILYRKLNAKVLYFKWAVSFFENRNELPDVGIVNKVKWMVSDINQVYYLKLYKRLKIAYKYAKTTGNFVNGFLSILYVIYYECKHFNKQRL